MQTREEPDLIQGSLRRVDVDLFIVHPSMLPAEITAALGLEAHFAQQIGDQRKTPDGKILEGRYRDSRWRHCIRYELTDQWFADKVATLVDGLVAHKAFFTQLRTTGGTAELIVQFLGDGYLADSVSAATLSKMADLQLDFGIECFNGPQS